MKKYILIVRNQNNRESLLNQALYTTANEARKSAGWFQKKIKAENEAYREFWKKEPVNIKSHITVAEVNY